MTSLLMDSSGQHQVTNWHLGMAGITPVSGTPLLALLMCSVSVYAASVGILPPVHSTEFILKFQVLLQGEQSEGAN